MSNPSFSWQKLQDVYYTIRPCYDHLKWPVDNLYSNYRVAVSPHATLLALATRLSAPNVVEVYLLSGVKLWSLVYNSTATDHIVDFAFCGEKLCVVLSSGKFRYYTDLLGTFNEYLYSEPVTKLAFRNEGRQDPAPDAEIQSAITNLETNKVVQPTQVLEVQVWGLYLALRFHNRLTLTDLHTFDTVEVPFTGLHHSNIHGMCLVASSESGVELILSYASTVYTIKVDLAEYEYTFDDEKLTEGPFSVMSASANGNLLALHNSNKEKIFVITRQFDKILLEYSTSNDLSKPFMMKWAGNDAIVLSLRDEIKLIGPGQKSLSFFYDVLDDNDLVSSSFTIPILAPQIDGLKIITENKVELLTRVLDAAINVYLVGSAHPALILLDCVDRLSTQASKADSNISLLRGENSLLKALDECLQAGLDEFAVEWQKKLMKAVSFGKIYESTNFDADKFLRVLHTLRALNQIRGPEIGVFLTHPQLEDIGWPGVIDMLLMRSQHFLALQIVELLQLQNCKDAIYVHWCCCKIRKELDMLDMALLDIIWRKLVSAREGAGAKSHKNRISVTEICEVAYQEGRIDLYKLLINLEPSLPKRARQLVELGQNELCLTTSFQACDYDLCKLIFLHYRDTMANSQLFKVLDQSEAKSAMPDLSLYPNLQNLVPESLFVSSDLLGNFWAENIVQDDERALKTYLQAYNRTTDIHLKALNDDVPLEQLDDEYQRQKSKLTLVGNDRNIRKLASVELEALEAKYKLSSTYHQSFLGLESMAAVLSKLVSMHQIRPAMKVAKEFRITPKKVWVIILDTYCKSGDFERLNKLLLEANSLPIGFDRVVETCLAYDCPKHYISSYIAKCSDLTYVERVNLYVKNQDLISAAEESLHNNDVDLLRSLQRKVPAQDTNVTEIIKSYLTRLRP